MEILKTVSLSLPIAYIMDRLGNINYPEGNIVDLIVRCITGALLFYINYIIVGKYLTKQDKQ